MFSAKLVNSEIFSKKKRVQKNQRFLGENFGWKILASGIFLTNILDTEIVSKKNIG